MITNLSEFIVCIVFFIVCNGMSEQPNTQKVNSKIALLAYHVSKKKISSQEPDLLKPKVKKCCRKSKTGIFDTIKKCEAKMLRKLVF